MTVDEVCTVVQTAVQFIALCIMMYWIFDGIRRN